MSLEEFENTVTNYLKTRDEGQLLQIRYVIVENIVKNNIVNLKKMHRKMAEILEKRNNDIPSELLIRKIALSYFDS